MYGETIAFLSAFVFALSNSMFKKIDRQVTPSQINFVRTTVAFVSFLIISAVLGWLGTIFDFSLQTWIFLFLSIITGQVIGDTAYFYAQKTLGTANALAISLTSPFFAIGFSALILGSEVETNLLLSATIITAGVSQIVYSKGQNEKIGGRTPVFIAIVLAFLAAIMWALGLVLIEMITIDLDRVIPSEQNSTLVANTARFPFAVIAMYLAMRATPSSSLHSLTRRTKAWLLTASVIGSSLGAWLWAESARVAGASFASIAIVTSPLMAVPISYAINREKTNMRGIAGMIITITGIIILLQT